MTVRSRVPRHFPICCLALLLALLFLGNDTAFADRGGVLFYAGFENNGQAIAAGNDQVTWKNGEAGFANGKLGQALLAGDGKAEATYEIDKNLMLRRGSIEFWFSPQDWNGDDDKFHVFFEAAEPGWMVIYKYYNPKEGLSGLFLLSADRKTWVYAKQDFGAIKPHEWHHLVATWSEAEMRLYLDGKPSEAITHPRLPPGLGTRFSIGDRASLGGEAPPKTGRDAHTLVDEFYIYDRPLNNAEVTWAYQHGTNRKAGDDVAAEVRHPILVLPHFLPAQGQMEITVQASGLDQFSGMVRLEPTAGTTGNTNPPATVPIAMTGEREGTATLPFLDRPAGDYRIVVDLKDAGGHDWGRESITIASPGPPVWRGNRIGLSDTPPPPWTPLKAERRDGADNNVISCWGRTCEMGRNGLPEQITALDRKLLQAPVALHARSNGQEVAWTPGPPRPIANNAVSAVSEGEWQSALGALHWKRTVEFDGMMRYDLELTPRPGAEADTMEIRVPVVAEHAGLNFILEPSGVWNKGTPSATPTTAGTVLKSNWVSYWWLGDEDRGLAGFCETDEAWDKVDRPDGFRFERNGDAVEAVWSFIGAPKKLGQPWKFTFGLQATPVKPLPTDWRRWRVAPQMDIKTGPAETKWLNPANKNVRIIWATPDVIRYYGYPLADKEGKLKQAVKELHAKGAKAITYTLVNAISSGSPEGRFYGEAWGDDANFPASTFSDVAAYNAGIRGMSPSKDWADFIAWSCDRFVRENDLDGLYHDLTHVIPSSNRALGFGYVRDGKVRPSYPIFEQREVYKRIYTLLKQHGKETGKDMFMMSHMSTNMVIPILSFSDAYLDGEHFASLGVKDNYLDFITLAGLRAEFMGRNYGVMPYFLPELQASVKQTGPTRSLLGLALLHDFQLWPLWSNANEVRRVYDVLDNFNIADTTILPYWNNGALIGGQTEAVKCTAYRGKNGTLLCITNVTREPQKVQLKLDKQLLGKGATRVTDSLDDKPVSLQQNTVALDLAPLDFRLIRVK